MSPPHLASARSPSIGIFCLSISIRTPFEVVLALALRLLFFLWPRVAGRWGRLWGRRWGRRWHCLRGIRTRNRPPRHPLAGLLLEEEAAFPVRALIVFGSQDHAPTHQQPQEHAPPGARHGAASVVAALVLFILFSPSHYSVRTPSIATLFFSIRIPFEKVDPGPSWEKSAVLPSVSLPLVSLYIVPGDCTRDTHCCIMRVILVRCARLRL
jgi:hypothetical protein